MKEDMSGTCEGHVRDMSMTIDMSMTCEGQDDSLPLPAAGDHDSHTDPPIFSASSSELHSSWNSVKL